MEKQIQYKGFTIIGTINTKIKGVITENIFHKELELFGGKVNSRYESPITFIFSDYDSMIEFIDENSQ